MAIFSETKTRLSVEDFNKAKQLLAANDRAGMYLLLAQKTGNPAYLNTAQISSGSGCLIGGPAIAINAYLQANYPDTYPKYSIADFSFRVADTELHAFEKITDEKTGKTYYQGPSELGSYQAGRQAWQNAGSEFGHPELVNLFPGNLLLYGHFAASGDLAAANIYVNQANSFLIPELGKASFQEIQNVGTQYGITLTQSLLQLKQGGHIEMQSMPGLNGAATVFYDASGKVYSVYTPKDIAVCGLEFGSPGKGVPGTVIKKVSFDPSDKTQLQPAFLQQNLSALFPDLNLTQPSSQQIMTGVVTALNLSGGNAQAYRGDNGELIISGNGRQTIVDLQSGKWMSSVAKSDGSLYFQDSDNQSVSVKIPEGHDPEVTKGRTNDSQLTPPDAGPGNGGYVYEPRWEFMNSYGNPAYVVRREVQNFADGSKWETLTLSDNSTQVITRNNAWQIEHVTTTSTTPDGSRKIVEADSTGKIVSTTLRKIDDAGNITETITKSDGSILKRETDVSGNVKETPVESGMQNALFAVGATVNFLNLINAIQSGKPLPIVAAGVNTLADLQKLTNNGQVNTVLNGTGAVLGALSSLQWLQQSIRNNDALGTVVAGAQTISYGAQAYIAISGTKPVNEPQYRLSA